MKRHSVLILPGDGIGPEVMREAVACLRAMALPLDFTEAAFGGAAIDAHGDPLPEATLCAARAADAIMLGAVGGPKWDAAQTRPEAGLLRLRAELGLFANLRPARVLPALVDHSPLRPERVAGADVLVVRELTGGLYFGEKHRDGDRASDLCVYTRAEVERVARIAFQWARRRRARVTSVDKANVLATSKLWRETVDAVARDYPDVALDHMYVDAAAMALVTHPTRFDVMLTENLFGDILSDELSVIAGSIGLLGSASEGASGPGLYEPIHGSAPDIAGQDIANPAGAIASAVMMLGTLGLDAAARALDHALDATLEAGVLTRDLRGSLGCHDFGEAVRARLGKTRADVAA